MFDMKLPFVLVLGLGLAGMAVAQTSTEPAPTEPAPATGTETPPADPAVIQGDASATTSDGLSLGKPATADGIGSTYTQETFVDWQLRCVRTASSYSTFPGRIAEEKITRSASERFAASCPR